MKILPVIERKLDDKNKSLLKRRNDLNAKIVELIGDDQNQSKSIKFEIQELIHQFKVWELHKKVGVFKQWCAIMQTFEDLQRIDWDMIWRLYQKELEQLLPQDIVQLNDEEEISKLARFYLQVLQNQIYSIKEREGSLSELRFIKSDSTFDIERTIANLHQQICEDQETLTDIQYRELQKVKGQLEAFQKELFTRNLHLENKGLSSKVEKLEVRVEELERKLQLVMSKLEL